MYFEDRKTSGSFAAMLVPLRGTIVRGSWFWAWGLGVYVWWFPKTEEHTPQHARILICSLKSPCNHHIPVEPDTSEKEYALNHVRVPGLM